MPNRLPSIGDPFDEWSDNIRSALVWLGQADPVETKAIARERDVHRTARLALLQAMFNAYGGEARTASQMIEDAKSGAIRPKGKKNGEISLRVSVRVLRVS
jgi:hypothetical protein